MSKPLTIHEFARMGGLARAAKLSPERRRAIALKASRASVKKQAERQRAILKARADEKKTA